MVPAVSDTPPVHRTCLLLCCPLRLILFCQTLETELPDTAASMRLSSLELSDCFAEMGALGSDLSSGLRASARLASAAESGVRQGAVLLGGSVVPVLAQKETQLRGEQVFTSARRVIQCCTLRLMQGSGAV